MILQRYQKRVAYFRSEGMAPMDRVFVHYGNTPQFFLDLLTVWGLGGCVIPIDPRLTSFEIETLVRAAKPRFSLLGTGLEEPIRGCLSALSVKILQTSDTDADSHGQATLPLGHLTSLDHEALILFTSGTTGEPKGVVHTHRSLQARWRALRQRLGVEKFRRTLCLLPTHFGHGLICNSLYPWLSGQDLFVVPPFEPRLLTRLGEVLDEYRITFMSSVPSVWRLALKTAKPSQSRTLERVCCGSAPLSAVLWKNIQEWTGTGEVLNAYGITETASWLAGTSIPHFTVEDGLIGVPWGADIKISKSNSTQTPPGVAEECIPGESGYIWINTPSLMRGYLDRDDLTSQVVREGWFLTGDIGFIDEQGLLYLQGREREEINKGGAKVYPADIDAVIERFHDTVDVCSFGYNDCLYGENVGIAVVLRPHNEKSLRGLYDWASQHLAKHQLPLRWYIVDEIPRTSRGKVNRALMAERCAQLSPVDPRDLSRRGLQTGSENA